jgi:CDP-glycerol glycerophosphotransferase
MPSRLPSIIRRVRGLPRRVARVVQDERRAAVSSRPVIQGTVLYESFGGNGALDNPEAIFRALLDDPDFPTLRHVWSVEPASSREFREEFARHPRVRFVRPRTVAYAGALARSEYLVNNATFPPEFRKRDGQIYLNTWHGTPLKRMGYDMHGGAFESSNILRNLVAADVLLSQNPHMSRMYTESYRLAGILPGRILEAGYPRTDRQHLDPDQRAAGMRMLRDVGIEIEGKKLVLYAPTWKGTDFGSPRDEAEELVGVAGQLQRLLGDGHVVALKAHQAVAKDMNLSGEPGLLIPNGLPTNVVLGLADVLVTDYSSIFVDFVGTGRPIIFHTPDSDDYARERGTYFDADELPGITTTTVAQLAEAILTPQSRHLREAAERWRRDFTPRDDGHAARRVIDAVFHNRPDPRLLLRPSVRRPSVLLYLGGMRSNGITTSALNLLAHLDHDALEVSVVMARPGGREQRVNAARIDSRVRQFHRRGGLGAPISIASAMRILGRLRPSHRESAWERRLWEGEWRRCLGDTRFDTVIDFSGYSRFWSELVLHSPPSRRLIWLHNDMAAEVERRVSGRRRMRRSLPAVFALYPRFDGLVSVSRDLSDANADALAGPYGIARSRFLSAGNVIDDEGARRMLRVPLGDAVEFRDSESGEVMVPDWAEQLARRDGTRWFVTVGRLSPEKNQARMLDAFALVHAEHPETRLAIVGDGSLRPELESRIAGLGLTRAVVLTGALSNPFAVLALCDCFVLSSDYEGQPMVLLEAAAAGLPMVTVRFGSVRDALPDGRLHVVEQTVAALAQGMRDYLAGTVAAATLDAAAYNDRALREFEAAMRLASDPSSLSSSSEVDISASRLNAPRTATASAAMTATPTTTSHHMRASSSGKRPRSG